MSRGLLLKTWRETRLALLLFGAGLMAFQALLANLVPVFFEHADTILQIQFIQRILKGVFGTEMGSMLEPTSIGAIAWVHPVVLVTLWAFEIFLGTRMPAGEVDVGTIDLLLGLPVSRRRLYLCETAFWLASGLVLISMGLAGALLGRLGVAPEFRPPKFILLMVAANLYCLYLAVGGLVWLVSCLSDHRGRAVAVIFAFLLVTFLLNFLSQLWEPAQAVQWLSLMKYYRPVAIVSEAAWPVRDMLVLASVGVVFWSAGWAAFARRDICTV